jgi:signal transduction histidine kinase
MAGTTIPTGSIGPDEGLVEARARARRAEDRLRSQTMLLAEAEHRLKTALAVISGWASTLDDRWDSLGEERRREGIRIVRTASDSLAYEARRLLHDARAELLALDPVRVEVDLCAILDVTTTALGGMSAAHRVEHRCLDASVPALVDPAALQQVLGHLVENAFAYSPAGSPVIVSSRRSGGMAVVEVVDCGIGVPTDIDVFAPFVRGEASVGTAGVGLGLYLVKNLVSAMGGDVSCHRHDDGPGSTFTVRLPAPG